jgi:hypothetical protein
VSGDLTSTAGIVALVAGGLALIGLVCVLILFSRLRRLQVAQRFILGEGGERDLTAHAQALHQAFDQLHGRVGQTFEAIDQRLAADEQRLTQAISHSAVIRYDAYNEMSGRQSSSIALLDDTGTGIVMSSILHREQARLYVKGVRRGQSEFELSPEEFEAIEKALSDRGEDQGHAEQGH